MLAQKLSFVWEGMQEQDIVSEIFIPKDKVVNLLVYRWIMPIILSVVTSVILSCRRRGTEFDAIALAVEKH
jgi:hypothetical protein